jgi:hypothetical protein
MQKARYASCSNFKRNREEISVNRLRIFRYYFGRNVKPKINEIMTKFKPTKWIFAPNIKNALGCLKNFPFPSNQGGKKQCWCGADMSCLSHSVTGAKRRLIQHPYRITKCDRSFNFLRVYGCSLLTEDSNGISLFSRPRSFCRCHRSCCYDDYIVKKQGVEIYCVECRALFIIQRPFVPERTRLRLLDLLSQRTRRVHRRAALR